jgi:hypothetical protein
VLAEPGRLQTPRARTRLSVSGFKLLYVYTVYRLHAAGAATVVPNSIPMHGKLILCQQASGQCKHAYSDFFLKYTNVDNYIRMTIYLYEHIYTHPIFMIISERLSRFNLKIHEVDH